MRTGRAMQVLGMMSGTSADGIDVALARISGAPPRISAQFRRNYHFKFSARTRETVLRIADGVTTSTAEISQLNFELGEEFALAAIKACKTWRLPLSKIDLIGSHGQTVFHHGQATRTRGARQIASTLQLGEPSIIAKRTRVTTIADFRPADIAAGGQGAPLVPFVDFLLYRDARRGRVALNVGGIANVSVIPAGARSKDVFAFDTGPGNMVVDALMKHFTHGKFHYDRDAQFALTGHTIPGLLARLMRDAYLTKKPPKTAGREEFGRAYTQRLIDWGKKHRARPADLVRTATVFTSLSIADAFHRFILPRVRVDDLIVAGGGARNPLMMAQLAATLPRITIVSADKWGVPAEAKEAFAFAVLAYEAYHQRANNLPTATGARHSVVMGKVVYGRPR